MLATLTLWPTFVRFTAFMASKIRSNEPQQAEELPNGYEAGVRANSKNYPLLQEGDRPSST